MKSRGPSASPGSIGDARRVFALSVGRSSSSDGRFENETDIERCGRILVGHHDVLNIDFDRLDNDLGNHI